MPTKHWLVQAAMKMHLSQPMGIGAFDGQHGMSSAISSADRDIDMSSAIEAIDESAVAPAITGEDNGANISPAIMTIASSRRMVIWRFTPTKLHKKTRIDSLPNLTTL
jgi:hypothetical protein